MPQVDHIPGNIPHFCFLYSRLGLNSALEFTLVQGLNHER